MAVWKYPLDFDHLPVLRLAKVLHLADSLPHPDPASEKDEHFLRGYCSKGSLCQPNSRLSLRGDSFPFCLCPRNRYGQRCGIEHDRCLSNPCENNGSCFPDSQPDQVICVCPKEYTGSQCQLKRSSIRLSLSVTVPYAGAVIQYFRIDFTALALILVDQLVFLPLPPFIEYFHPDQTILPELVLAKIYSPEEDLHLLSLHLSAYSIVGRTEISPANRCEHRRTFSNGNSFSILPGRLIFL